MLEYPTVVSPAISQNGQWPDGLAIGMLMARAGAPFIRHAFKGYQDYRGNNYLYNAIMRSYRTYEHYPDTVSFDPHFTVSAFSSTFRNIGCGGGWVPFKFSMGLPFKFSIDEFGCLQHVYLMVQVELTLEG